MPPAKSEEVFGSHCRAKCCEPTESQGGGLDQSLWWQKRAGGMNDPHLASLAETLPLLRTSLLFLPQKGVLFAMCIHLCDTWLALYQTLIDSNIFLYPFTFIIQVVPSLPLTDPKDHLTHTLFSENKSKSSFSWPLSPHLKSQLLLLFSS